MGRISLNYGLLSLALLLPGPTVSLVLLAVEHVRSQLAPCLPFARRVGSPSTQSHPDLILILLSFGKRETSFFMGPGVLWTIGSEPGKIRDT